MFDKCNGQPLYAVGRDLMYDTLSFAKLCDGSPLAAVTLKVGGCGCGLPHQRGRQSFLLLPVTSPCPRQGRRILTRRMKI